MTDVMDDEGEVEWLNVKEDFTGFGPGSPASVLETEFPELFERARDDETAVTYNPMTREFGIPVLDGGGSVIAFQFDPWTGRRLPAGLRDRFFDELEALGIDPWSDDRPEAFCSEAWWRERGL